VARCDTEIDILKNEIDQDIWTFRWVWLVNLAAIIWGAVMHHWDIVVISAISAAIALVGIGRTRRDRHTVDRVADVCIPRQEEK
jgi:hypothetical protein